jgi:hypothetical protein
MITLSDAVQLYNRELGRQLQGAKGGQRVPRSVNQDLKLVTDIGGSQCDRNDVTGCASQTSPAIGEGSFETSAPADVDGRSQRQAPDQKLDDDNQS